MSTEFMHLKKKPVDKNFLCKNLKFKLNSISLFAFKHST